MADRSSVTITTIADGTATGYSDLLSGRLSSIRYVKDDYAAGVDFTITDSVTGEALWTGTDVNASVTVAPRMPTTDNAGAASLYAAAGEPVEDYYVLSESTVKIVIAQGGDTKNGTFHITVF